MSRRRSPVRDRAEYAAYRLARGAAATLGPRGGTAVGGALGDAFWLTGVRRGIVRFNLRLAFPTWSEDERRRLAREVARHFGRVLVDALRLQGVGRDELLAAVETEGLEHAARALSLGRGVVYLTAHLGSWEVSALAMGLLRPEPLDVINRPLDNPLLEAELGALRGRFGNRTLGKRQVARGVLRRLGEGGAVGILIDQKVRPEVGVEVPFFGQPAWTHPILARLVRHTRAPVVPVAATWEAPGRYRLRLSEPVLVDELPAAELEDAPLTARFTAILEAMIRERPEQWLWYHDRWRHLRRARKGHILAP